MTRYRCLACYRLDTCRTCLDTNRLHPDTAARDDNSGGDLDEFGTPPLPGLENDPTEGTP